MDALSVLSFQAQSPHLYVRIEFHGYTGYFYGQTLGHYIATVIATILNFHLHLKAVMLIALLLEVGIRFSAVASMYRCKKLVYAKTNSLLSRFLSKISFKLERLCYH